MGLQHIQIAFEKSQDENRAALMPYFSLGYPNPEASLDIVQAMADSGADLIELGVPFSDPLADGPTIQRSTQIALEQGMTVKRCLEMVGKLRERGVNVPLILMGYYNPIFAFGVERFASEASKAGADGFIIPDLPLDEAAEVEAACQAQDLALIAMLAPTSTEARIKAACDHARGFLYLVSLTGVTGVRDSLPPDLTAFVERVRKYAHTPLAVGFGISTPEQAAAVGQIADGVIVGSAVIREGMEGEAGKVAGFVCNLRHAMEKT
jgi:tryptophan synthase alpha chain